MKFPPRQQAGEGGEGGGGYLRLKDGESVTGILRGDIHVFYAIGFGADTRVVGPGQGGKRKYRHAFVVKEGQGYAAKIWEFGPKIYDSLSALEAGGWDLQKTLLTINRTGSTKENTKYTVTPNRQEPSEAALNAITALELPTLAHGERAAAAGASSAQDSEGLPF